MNYGKVFNSFDELYNAKPFQQYPIGADRFEEYRKTVERAGEQADGEFGAGIDAIIDDNDLKAAAGHFGNLAKGWGKAISSFTHTDQAGREAGKAIRSGLDAAREFKKGNRKAAVGRLGSSLAHTGKAALRTAEIPLEVGKTMASRLAWSPSYNIEKFYREHTNLRDAQK